MLFYNQNIFNINTFKKNHKKALLIYSYSKRSYGENITAFLKNLGTERNDLLNVMISQELPKIKIKN